MVSSESGNGNRESGIPESFIYYSSFSNMYLPITHSSPSPFTYCHLSTNHCHLFASLPLSSHISDARLSTIHRQLSINARHMLDKHAMNSTKWGTEMTEIEG
jgi:hypothetical protein